MPAPKRKEAATSSNSLASITGKARRYVLIRDEEGRLKKEKEELSAILKDAAENLGEADGLSFKLRLDGVTVSKIGVVKNKIDHSKALAVLQKLGLEERCTTKVLNEKELELAFQEGLIGMDEINSFTTEEISYRIDVR